MEYCSLNGRSSMEGNPILLRRWIVPPSNADKR